MDPSLQALLITRIHQQKKKQWLPLTCIHWYPGKGMHLGPLAASTSSSLCYKLPSICLYAAVTLCLYARIKDRNSTPYCTLVLRHQLVLSISGKLLHTYEHSNCVLPYLSVVTNKHWCCIVYWTMSQSIHRCTFLFAFTILPLSPNKCRYAIRTGIYRK